LWQAHASVQVNFHRFQTQLESNQSSRMGAVVGFSATELREELPKNAFRRR